MTAREPASRGQARPTSISFRAKALIEASERATPGPWIVRPKEFDDWGVVRVAPDGALTVIGRAGRQLSEGDETAHRFADTDPYGPNAEFAATARNDAPDIAAALVEAVEVMRALLEPETVEKYDGTNWLLKDDGRWTNARAWLAKWEKEP